jgi:hypothetical protein
MIIYIEFLILGLVFFIFLGWSIWYNLSTTKLRRKYDEQRRRESKGTGELGTSEGSVSSKRPFFFKGRELLPPTDSISTGENSNSTRKFFKKRG